MIRAFLVDWGLSTLVVYAQSRGAARAAFARQLAKTYGASWRLALGWICWTRRAPQFDAVAAEFEVGECLDLLAVERKAGAPWNWDCSYCWPDGHGKNCALHAHLQP